jgi:alkylation response protein AidB-like acyl-CoA dehydrogenase
MDFNYTPEEEAFRKEVRDWLAENMKELPDWWGRTDIAGPETDSDEYREFSLWWHRKLHAAGYVGLAWPKEHGGRGATVIEQAIFNEEMAKHGAPGASNAMGVSWVGPMMLAHGTEEHRKRFLPKILSGEEMWCTLYSEPGAGSDLASVQTRAVEEGDEFVINGQKVWTSAGAHSDWGVCLARTDPDLPKHRGLSYLFFDMHSPGITLSPLPQITGHTGFYETFLDDVRIPKTQILGEKNMGWYVVMGALEFERSLLGQTAGYEKTVQELIKIVKTTERNGRPLSKDPIIRQKLAQLFIEVNVAKYIGIRTLTQ